MQSAISSIEGVFGPVVYSYTREQAIQDGVLIDVTETAKEAGIRFHTAITVAVLSEYVSVPEELEGMEDEQGRLWDILWMFSVAARRGEIQGNQGRFEVLVSKSLDAQWLQNEQHHTGLQQRLVTLKAVCGPNGNGRPCITIMMPDED